MPPQQGETLLDLFGQVADLGTHGSSDDWCGWLARAV
jgi:hypothetical protein